MTRPVVLCTDFGPGSPYVGQMKLVIAQRAPAATIVDLAHDLPPQNLTAAALVLQAATALLPRPGVLCAVVDPGVGSERRIVVLETGDDLLIVAPDNGLPRSIPGVRSAFAVENPELLRLPVSPVFHGRDIFAPTAAALASGMTPSEAGPAVDLATLAPLPRPLRAAAEDAEIVYVDSFGNLISNLHRDDLPADVAGATIGGASAQWASHYAEAPDGALIALVGSFDTLEIALRGGSATRVLGMGVGARFSLARATPPPASQSR